MRHLHDGSFAGAPVFFPDGPDSLPSSVHEQVVERVDCDTVEDSLLLQKPTREVPHTGGMVFTTGRADPRYQTLKRWAEEGAQNNTRP
jgi:hypothetical protein